MDDKLNAALKGLWDSLTDEQKEQAKGCRTLDELTALAAKEGIELPDELLDAVAGGYLMKTDPKYGSPVWQVLDDKTLKPIHEHEWYSEAEDWAQKHGQSTAILSQWSYEQKKKELDGRC